MKIKIEFSTDNAAFEGAAREFEIKRILRRVFDRITEGATYPQDLPNWGGAVVDLNGNTVGTFEVDE